MGRKILFITTDQQRYDSLGCNGGRIARTPVADSLAAVRHQLSARLQSEHGLHARAIDHDHRPVRAHSRRVRQRRPAARRRAQRRRIAARSRGLSHRAYRQGALRADVRSIGAMAGESHGPRTLARTASRIRSDGARDARADGLLPLLELAARELSRRGRRLRHDAVRRGGRRQRRARGHIQSDSARALSHRLGCRSHHRVSQHALCPTTIGSCG